MNTKGRNQAENPKVKEKKPITRMPRPWGLTTLCTQYHYTLPDNPNKQELKQKIITHTLTQYLQKDLTINGELYSIESLAIALGLPLQETQTQLNKLMLERGTMFDEGQKGAQYARVLFNRAVQKSLEYQALTENQARILASQQGNQYVPFLSSALNQALGNLGAAQKPVHELLKMLLGNSPLPVLPAVGEEAGNGPRLYLSPEKAMELIASNQPSLLESSTELDAKETALIGLPEVGSRYQDLSNIGIRKSELKVPLEPTKGTLQPNEAPKNRVPKTHETRRTSELNIVEDEEDWVA